MIRHGYAPLPGLENGGFLGPALELEKGHGNGKKFFQIIHSETIRDQKLAIPMKFLRKSAKDLADFANLKAPRGPTWRIELKKGPRGDVWFHNGWQDFVEYYSISPTDFLLFEYAGNSQFHVLIFDASGSEIDYHVCNPKNFDEHRRISSMNPMIKKETV